MPRDNEIKLRRFENVFSCHGCESTWEQRTHWTHLTGYRPQCNTARTGTRTAKEDEELKKQNKDLIHAMTKEKQSPGKTGKTTKESKKWWCKPVKEMTCHNCNRYFSLEANWDKHPPLYLYKMESKDKQTGKNSEWQEMGIDDQGAQNNQKVHSKIT